MHIFIATGEVSGDLQGALLVESLFRQAQGLGIDLKITALGGDRMAQAGATLIGDTSRIGSIGLIEALPFIIPTLVVQRRAKKYLKQNPPDLIVLIDYVGPNLSLGAFVRRHLPQVPILYYIAPQAWVWSFNGRLTQRFTKMLEHTEEIAEVTDRILAIFPEEARYFTEHGVDVKWIGHPLVSHMAKYPSKIAAREQLGLHPDQTIVTLLPASRRQELKYLLPVIAEAAKNIQNRLSNVKFLVPVALPQYRKTLEDAMNAAGLNAILIDEQQQTPLAIAAADLAITKSGTVNLEIALLNVPQVVLYKVHPFTYWLSHDVLKFSIPFMCPVNLMLMREIVPELLQHKATAERITEESLEFLGNAARREELFLDYKEMRAAMGEEDACEMAAIEILQYPTPKVLR